jgi:dolichyl-phosphate beta-glucosyltransferase
MPMDSVALIIPCYNEEKRIPLPAFSEFLKNHPPCSILFVNDGSTDRTHSLLSEFCKTHPQAQLLRLEKNSGKAEAVRQGGLHLIHQSQAAKWIGYWDADLATPLEEVTRFFWFVGDRIPSADLLIGSRLKIMGTSIVRHARRHYLGRIFATAAANTLGIPIYDTQCGAKILRSSLVPQVFEKPFLSHWIFDVEIIMRVLKFTPQHQTRGSNIYEIPLSKWQDLDGSKLKLRDWLIAPLELFKIWYRYR